MIALFFSPIDPNYTSGELLDHAQAWKETGTLYPSLQSAPYRVLNYPPLFLSLTRGLSQLGIPLKASGHLVTWVCVFGALLILYRWLRSQGNTRGESLAVLSFLGASYAAIAHAALFHLQWPAVFVSLLGLFLLRSPTRLTTSLLAGILLGLACWLKQTQALSALIAFFWLLRYHRIHAASYAEGLFLAGLAGGIWIHFSFGPEAWRHLITYTVGTYSPAQLLREWGANVLPWLFFAYGAFRWAFENTEHRRDLRSWYLVGTTLGLLSAARVGSGAQYFVEWGCAVLLCWGPILKRRAELLCLSRFALPLLVLQLVLGDLVTAARLTGDTLRLKHRLSILPSLCAKISSTPSPLIPIGEPGLARACGRGAALHPFIMAELAKKGLWDETPFLKELENGVYPIAILPFDPKTGPRGFDRERWTQRMVEAFRRNYQVSGDERGWKALEYVRRRE